MNDEIVDGEVLCSKQIDIRGTNEEWLRFECSTQKLAELLIHEIPNPADDGIPAVLYETTNGIRCTEQDEAVLVEFAWLTSKRKRW